MGHSPSSCQHQPLSLERKEEWRQLWVHPIQVRSKCKPTFSGLWHWEEIGKQSLEDNGVALQVLPVVAQEGLHSVL